MVPVEAWLGVLVLPFLTRLLAFGLCCRGELGAAMGEEENDRDTHRTILLALAALSFTGIFALSVADTALRQGLLLPILFLTSSFLCYFFALNLQGWKYARWHDVLIGDSFYEAGSLALLLSLVALIWQTNPWESYAWGIAAFASLGWLVDHYKRTSGMVRYLWEKATVDKQQKGETAWVVTRRGIPGRYRPNSHSRPTSRDRRV